MFHVLQGIPLPLPTLAAPPAVAPAVPAADTHVHTEHDALPPMSAHDDVQDDDDDDDDPLTWSGGVHPLPQQHDDIILVHLHVDPPPQPHPACTLTVDHATSHVTCTLTVDHATTAEHVHATLAIHHVYHEDTPDTGQPVPLRQLFSRSAHGGALAEGGPALGELGRAASNVAHAAGQGLVGISGRVWGAAVQTATHAVGHARHHTTTHQPHTTTHQPHTSEGGEMQVGEQQGSAGPSPRGVVEDPPATEAQRAQRGAAVAQVCVCVGVWGG